MNELMQSLQARLGPNAKAIRWVQEEPRNMGAWLFIYPRLLERFGKDYSVSYAGRASSASPATGSSEAHKMELARFVEQAYAPL